MENVISYSLPAVHNHPLFVKFPSEKKRETVCVCNGGEGDYCASAFLFCVYILEFGRILRWQEVKDGIHQLQLNKPHSGKRIWHDLRRPKYELHSICVKYTKSMTASAKHTKANVTHENHRRIHLITQPMQYPYEPAKNACKPISTYVPYDIYFDLL